MICIITKEHIYLNYIILIPITLARLDIDPQTQYAE